VGKVSPAFLSADIPLSKPNNTTIDQNLKTVELMSKKPGKLLMKLFLHKQNKAK